MPPRPHLRYIVPLYTTWSTERKWALIWGTGFQDKSVGVTSGLQLVPCLVTRDRYIHIYESNTIGIIEDLGQNQKALVVLNRGWFYKIHF